MIFLSKHLLYRSQFFTITEHLRRSSDELSSQIYQLIAGEKYSMGHQCLDHLLPELLSPPSSWC